MSLRDWWNKLVRDRDQETVVLAERGIAPEDEVRETEEWIASRHHDKDADAATDDEARGG